MNSSIKENVIDQLWDTERPDGAEVYALLDGARNEEIYDHIVTCGLDWMCLYSGKLAPELAKVAPYIVRLERNHLFTRTIIQKGWGEHWGIFARSAAPITVLRKHFHSFLTVQDEDGNRLVFRYYDPRILRVYLPTCRLSELLTVFGPVDDFILAAPDPSEFMRFRVRDDQLATEQRSLLDAFSSTSPEENLSP